MPTSAHVSVAARGIRCPGAGFIGGCEFRSSIKVASFQPLHPSSVYKRGGQDLGIRSLPTWSPGFWPIRETGSKIKLEIEFLWVKV